jgi:hypothetical protein
VTKPARPPAAAVPPELLFINIDGLWIGDGKSYCAVEVASSTVGDVVASDADEAGRGLLAL